MRGQGRADLQSSFVTDELYGLACESWNCPPAALQAPATYSNCHVANPSPRSPQLQSFFGDVPTLAGMTLPLTFLCGRALLMA